MTRSIQLFLLCAALLHASLQAQSGAVDAPLGGPATIFDTSPNAFGFASPSL